MINRLLIIGIIAVLTSCNNSNEKSDKEKSEKKKVSEERVKNNVPPHEAFNEPVDKIDENLKQFIPSDYSAIKISSGDLNLDGITDKILVLRKDSEATTSNNAEQKPDKRPLIMLLGKSDNSFKQIKRNDNAVLCIDCDGVFGDPFTGITIKNGYFSIEHGIAGGQHWEQVTTFKFDKSKEDWLLYKDHFISYKLNESDNEDAEALVVNVDKLKTVKDFGIVSFDNYDTYNEK